MNKNNKVDIDNSREIIKNCQYLKNNNLVKIKNSAKFKSIKNFTKYKKSIRNLIQFKIFKKLTFLSSATRLSYNQLK